MPRFSESLVLVAFIEPSNYGSAGIDSDAVNIGLENGCTVQLIFGALTGNSILTVYASAARDLKTTAIAFSYRLGGGAFKAALADQFGDPIAVASTGLTLTAATFQHKQVVVEVDPDVMPSGKPWLTFSIDATATVLNVAGSHIGRPRYPGHLIPSIL